MKSLFCHLKHWRITCFRSHDVIYRSPASSVIYFIISVCLIKHKLQYQHCKLFNHIICNVILVNRETWFDFRIIALSCLQTNKASSVWEPFSVSRNRVIYRPSSVYFNTSLITVNEFRWTSERFEKCFSRDSYDWFTLNACGLEYYPVLVFECFSTVLCLWLIL